MNVLFLSALAEEAAEVAEEAVEAVEEAAEAAPSWFQTAFGDLADMPVWGWILLALLLVGGVIAYRAIKGGQKTVWTTRMLSVGAMCIALSSVLSMIKLFEMPNGGSVTAVSLLPLILFAYVYGTVPGLILGFVHGVLQFMFGGWFLNVFQFLLDYPLAFAVLGLAGLFNKMKDERAGLAVGTVVGCAARWFVAALAGLVFWSDLTEGIWPAVVYTVTYNASYMIPECIITAVIAVLVGPRLIKELRKVK